MTHPLDKRAVAWAHYWRETVDMSERSTVEALNRYQRHLAPGSSWNLELLRQALLEPSDVPPERPTSD